MPRNRSFSHILIILKDRMSTSFSNKKTFIFFKMFNEITSFHIDYAFAKNLMKLFGISFDSSMLHLTINS